MKRIFVNGTFDIVHVGHINLLNYAKSLGNYLLVAIDTDERVRSLKGKDRPINSQSERSFLLSNLKAVDEVKFFNDDAELISILVDYKPDIIVKGSDHKEGSKLSKMYCNEVIFYERDGNSTTKKIQDIVDRR